MSTRRLAVVWVKDLISSRRVLCIGIYRLYEIETEVDSQKNQSTLKRYGKWNSVWQEEKKYFSPNFSMMKNALNNVQIMKFRNLIKINVYRHFPSCVEPIKPNFNFYVVSLLFYKKHHLELFWRQAWIFDRLRDRTKKIKAFWNSWAISKGKKLKIWKVHGKIFTLTWYANFGHMLAEFFWTI